MVFGQAQLRPASMAGHKVGAEDNRLFNAGFLAQADQPAGGGNIGFVELRIRGCLWHHPVIKSRGKDQSIHPLQHFSQGVIRGGVQVAQYQFNR